VNFKNTVIIMTSNLGSQFIQKMESMGFGGSAGGAYEGVKDKVLESLKEHFRPEFLNRVDETIVFDVLTPEVLVKIVDLRVAQVTSRLLEKGIFLDVSPEALSYLAKEGYDPHYGARPLNRLIQTKILNPVAKFIISNGIGKGDTVMVSMKGEEMLIEMKKGKKRVVKTKEKIQV
ncbi:MAG: AAA family ATPase, partial [Candidatus Pacebacteria bacterium]|nr:AAA family ATPase [Candidatus Paceibacterota bacterium]